jgi:DNA-binding transcriptional ArsR family regulator
MDALEAVAAPRRRKILRLVWDSERSAGEIASEMPEVTFSAVSQHLRVLEAARLVKVRSEGRSRYYAAEKSTMGPLRQVLEEMWDGALARLKQEAEGEVP